MIAAALAVHKLLPAGNACVAMMHTSAGPLELAWQGNRRCVAPSLVPAEPGREVKFMGERAMCVRMRCGGCRRIVLFFVTREIEG